MAYKNYFLFKTFSKDILNKYFYPVSHNYLKANLRGNNTQGACGYLFIICFSIYLFLSPSILFAEGTNAGDILIQSLSAKAQGMGEAFASIPANEGQVTALQYNPASIGFLNQREISVTYKGGVFGDNTGIISFGSPLDFLAGRSNLGNFAGTLLYESAGDVDYVDGAGTKKTVNAQKDIGFILSYSHPLLWENLTLGANGKILNSKLVENFSATAFALDLGTMLKMGTFAFGGSLQNMGTALKYNRTNEYIPFTFRIGASNRMKWFKQPTLVSMDMIKQRDSNVKFNFGLEYIYADSKFPIAFRTGYKLGEDTGKINFGLGFSLANVKLDYSMQVVAGTENSHFVTLGFLFGGSGTESFSRIESALQTTQPKAIPRPSIKPASKPTPIPSKQPPTPKPKNR